MAELELGRLRDRLYRFNSTGDPVELLSAELEHEIKVLVASPGLEYNMAAVEIVAWLYWYRSQAIPEGDASAERESATKLFELMYISDPQSVPGALQPVLRERRLAKQRDFATSPFTEPVVNFQETIRRSTELFQRYCLTSDPATLDDSISGFRTLLAAVPPSFVMRPMCEIMLGQALHSLWERTNDTDALVEGIARLRAGLGALPAMHEMRPAAMGVLSAMLGSQYVQHEDPALLAEALRLIDEAAATAPPDHMLHAQLQSAREMLRTVGPASLNDPGGLDHAITAARVRLNAAPPGHPDRPQAVLQLGMAMAARFTITRLADSLEETVALLREAVAGTPSGSAALPALRAMLGCVLSEVALRDGDLATTAEAIDLIRTGLPGLGPKNPLTAAMHGSLAVALWQRYLTTEEPALLAEAITEGRLGLELISADSPMRAPLLHNLGCALTDLHRRTGDMAALDEAIELSRRTERTGSGTGATRAIAMNSLAGCLILRHRRTGDKQSVDEAVTWGKRAVEAAGKDHPDRPTFVVTLAQALQGKYDSSDHPADLQEATDLLRQSAHMVTVREHTARDIQHVANALASALLKRSHDNPDLPAVEEALGWLRRATADTTESPSRDRCLGLLGKALQRRYELTRDRGALAEAVDAFGSVASRALSPILRVFRNVELGRTAADLFDWPLALDGFGTAVEGLSLVTARHLDRVDQEHALTPLAGLAADAAACALNAQQPERAADLLERGRGVLLAQLLQTRGDLDELGDRDPRLAAGLAAVRDQLDALDHSGPDPEVTRRDPQAAGRRAGLRRELASQWDELLTQIRSRQGFEDFLRAPALADLARGATDDGPIVLLNVSRYRSDAILLTAGGTDVVPLSASGDLHAAARQRAAEFTTAVGHADDDDDGRRAAARSQVTGTLGWLWDSVAAPVLSRLGWLAGAPSATGDLPRIWWCAGGPLSLLPLHAAGRDGTAVIDRAVSSYTPTVRALCHARDRTRALSPSAGMLAIAMSLTPGAAGLPRAAEEMKWLRNTFGARTLLNEQATRDRVLDALPRYPIVHFAGHCVTDLATPSASGLLCHDGADHPLTVAQISRLDLPAAALAYLSACSTSQTSAALADEAVHVTTAFQLAGYGQVIGTLWTVGDRTCAQVARDVYQALRQDTTRTASAAHSLHNAVQAIRREAGHEAAWAPYVHIGA